MLLSLAYIFLLALMLGFICKKLKLPALLGMMATGMLLGPYVFNLIDPKLLNISSELRKIALIIILLRAGLSLNLEDLKAVGRPAILMCFVPACFEIMGSLIFGQYFLGLSLKESFVLGSVLAAVSPAVIVPKMIKLMEEGYGQDKKIAQMILAGASVDDVFVIVMFSCATSLMLGEKVSAASFISIPVSIILGALAGYVIGLILDYYFKFLHQRDTSKIIIMLSIAFILVSLEDTLPLPFSGLIAIMAMGIALKKENDILSGRLQTKLNKLWVCAEILLFVLVGALVDLSYALNAGVAVIFMLLGALIFRMAGVYGCMLKTKLNTKERLFCMMAYTPKATVQAAIGGIPLSYGFACGNIVLSVAVMAIIITAPLGAFMIDMTYKRLLSFAKL